VHPRFDPVASLRVWAVEVTLSGRLLRVPALSAADWLPVVMTANPMAVVDLLEDFDLAEALVDDGITLEELQRALTEIVESAAGRSSTATFVLAGAAAERWDVVGADLARAGVRFGDISLGAALDAIYGSLIRHMDEKGAAELNRLLTSGAGGGLSHPRRGPGGVRRQPATATQSGAIPPKTQLLPRTDLPDGLSVQPSEQLQLPDGSDPPEVLPSVPVASESPLRV
jgi:hypothetical protein